MDRDTRYDNRAANPLPVINNRYRLLEPLGAGGMGIVFKALDRLSGRPVALKQITQVTYDPERDIKIFLTLAREFKTLAALRHPHIVAVLDYGFDERHRPFFTMELLPEARPLTAAAAGLPRSEQIELLLQLLQALTYLHRQGISHGDLKPDNVLVSGGRVRVLDFGLVTNIQLTQAESSGGTLAYMAPELFDDERAHSPQADLYAVGVMAYELLTGRFPFDKSSVQKLLMSILMTTPIFDDEALGVELAMVLRRLLAKEAGGRYASARETMAALSAADGRSLPAESAEIRESYLQAAHFVGRKEELGRLRWALEGLAEGRGGLWLIGGESGVGKSRLLDELRIRALVEGIDVFQGQALEEGSRPYQLWLKMFRRLALATGIGDPEAAVLGTVTPDIERLIDRPLKEEPVDHSRERLLVVVTALLDRAQRPALFVLEDLHWADSASLALLTHLAQAAGERPLLLVGSYRDDERPGLLRALPAARVLRLERLTLEETAQLSTAMLGESGRDAGLAARLQQETEGNPFFLVEVVRALAEESGGLDRVGRAALPESIFTAGLAAIIQRRLGRTPDEARPLLELAAVAGRELDPALLQVLAPGMELDDWLARCAEATVLEVDGRRWRFSHNKLRDGLLAGVRPERLAGLHRQVAEALENLYPDAPEQQVALAHHWRMAGDEVRELSYALAAARSAAAAYAHREAIALYERAAAIYRARGEEGEEAQTLIQIGAVHHIAFNFEQAQAAYDQGFALWQKSSGQADRTLPPAARPLRVSWDEPPTLEPFRHAGLYDYYTSRLFAGLLTRELLPDLAGRWEISEGGRVYLFHLRPDAYWSDGVPVTAGDFLYVLDNLTWIDLNFTIQVVNDHTLRVELEEPDSSILHQLSNFLRSIPAHSVSRHGSEWVSPENVVSSGPYKLDHWEEGRLLTFVRNDSYPGHIRGNVQQVEVRVDFDADEQWDHYLAGKLDTIQLVSYQVQLARQQFPNELVSFVWPHTYYLMLNTSAPPFDDRRVRRALALAVDRRALFDEQRYDRFTSTGYVPATGGLVPAGFPGHSPGLSAAFDPGQARQLLAEAGYGPAAVLPIGKWIIGGHLAPLARRIKAQWQENLGLVIQAEEEIIPWDTLAELITAEANLLFSGWIGEHPDPLYFLRDAIADNQNILQWQDAPYYSLLAEAVRTVNQEERLALAQQADRRLIQEAALIPLAYAQQYFLVKPWLRQFLPDPVAWENFIIEPH